MKPKLILNDSDKFLKCCRPLLALFNLVGIRVNPTELPRNTSGLTRITRLAAFVMASLNFLIQMYTFIDGVDVDDLWILSFNDNWFVLTFFFVICIRDREIESLTTTIMRLSILNCKNGKDDNFFRKIRKVSLCLTLMIVILNIILSLHAYFFVMLSIYCDEWFQCMYFNISVSVVMRIVISASVELTYSFSTIFMTIYSAYFIFLIFLLYLSYQTINNNFKTQKYISLSDSTNFQQKHYQLNELIDQFNRLFSPAMLFLPLTLIGQFMGIPVMLNSQLQLFPQFYYPDVRTFLRWFELLCVAVKVFCILFTLIMATHRVQHHVKFKITQI
ncbi:hypothetical protein CHUAL_001265 [Chamberlinius hualienensis]